ncbi:hypothetical protein [Flaviaesturariibacter amylovorans]|uniref:Uncharacterized protein n=1 Tax=Flaviaesturariibacter amylovorans TaxID=1084520 RepID=A0ABP8H8B8_9BACT
MSQVTLLFPSLADLAECMYHLSIRRPVIDYDRFTLTAELTPEQVERAKKFHGVLVDRNVML